MAKQKKAATKKQVTKKTIQKIPNLYIRKIQREDVQNVGRHLTRVFYAVKEPCGCSERAFLEFIWDQENLTDKQIEEAIHELHKNKDRRQE